MPRANPSVDQRSKVGTDFLQLDRASAPRGRLAAWLADQIRAAIADGRLPAGATLPPTRVLAAELQVARGTVSEAYQRLTEEGQIAGRGRGGTVVLDRPRRAAAGRVPRRRVPAPAHAGTVSFTGAPTGPVFDELRTAPAAIDLSPGVPDLAAFPRAAWLRAERAVLNSLSPADFGYGQPAGAPAFRARVADWLARNRRIAAEPDDVVIVSGVAQALALVARVLRAEGMRTIAVEDPGSLGARQQLQSWGVATPPVRVDERGIDVAALAASGAPAVMLTPAHQFPTGVVLDGARRRELHDWASAGGLVIEDDYDAEHRYDRPPVPALRAQLPEQVCYTGSVSKLLAPALRIGWLLVPARYRDAVIAAKRDSDLGNAVLPQLVLGELMRSGDLERHLRFVRRRHRARRDATIAAIAQHLRSVQVHGAAAGLHLTITFADRVDDVALAAAAFAAGVKVQPLSWHCQSARSSGLVLGYAATSPGEIERGIAILGRQLRRLLAP
jgi:GntR family transcriptional regulator/MocR family aminotransferase